MERTDILAIVLACAAIPAGAALMAAPVKFPSMPAIWVDICFYGGIALTAILLIAAIIIAAQDNRTLSAVGMVVFGALFLLCLGWYFWPSQLSDPAATADKKLQSATSVVPIEESPPIGSLRYVTSTMDINISNSTRLMSGRIEVEIHNDTDKTIYYYAITAGNINGVPFDENKIEFNGYIYPRQSGFLMSKRLFGLSFRTAEKPDEAPLRSIYEYDLRYRYADTTVFTRHSARGIQFDEFNPPGSHPIGTSLVKPMKVTLYNEIEE